MEGVKEKQGQLIFGLDIGTRSIVGTVGYLNGGKFHVLAQRSKEHETRAMLDGQIHDIGKVGETISQVKEQLEEDLGRELTDVCIAAGGGGRGAQQVVYCVRLRPMLSIRLKMIGKSCRKMFILCVPWVSKKPMRNSKTVIRTQI